MRKSLRISYWNCCNGVDNKITELAEFMQNHEVDVALLNRINLKPSKRYTISNFSINRQALKKRRKNCSIYQESTNIEDARQEVAYYT